MRLDPEKDYELRCRCPDCGEVWAEVVSTSNGEVTEVACPTCPAVDPATGREGANVLQVRGTVRRDQLRELVRREPTHYAGGDDDGE